MARQQEQQQPPAQAANDSRQSRVVLLARDIYLAMVTSNTAKTPAHLASEALEKAAIFWTAADARNEQRQ